MHAFVAALPPASSMGLAFYLLLIVGAAFAGGSSIAFLSLGHRRMQVLLSLTGGIMLGVGLLHLLPHAALELNGRLDDTMPWVLAGFFGMFLLERAFRSHAHHAADGTHDGHCQGAHEGHDHAPSHRHGPSPAPAAGKAWRRRLLSSSLTRGAGRQSHGAQAIDHRLGEPSSRLTRDHSLHVFR